MELVINNIKDNTTYCCDDFFYKIDFRNLI